jgi:FtsZ-interacting cell division protein ZipA
MYLLLFFIGLAFLGLVIYLFPKLVGFKTLEAFIIVDFNRNRTPYVRRADPTAEELQTLQAEMTAAAQSTPTLPEITQSAVVAPPIQVEQSQPNTSSLSVVAPVEAPPPPIVAAQAPPPTMASLLATPVISAPLPSPTAQDPVIVANGLKPQPSASTSTRSMPQQTNMPETRSKSLDQGRSFMANAAFPAQPTPAQPIRTSYRRPPVKQCPDMRDYIRKDSIPCWSCKLN